MRLAPLLFFAVLHGTAVGCASSGSEDAASGSADTVAGIPNDMGLKMEYDVPSSTIRATLGRALSPTEQLFFQIRRGRLSQTSAAELDCSRLPVAPPMPDGSQGLVANVLNNAGYAEPVIYQGPLVDPSLLATVYDSAWIEAHVSAKGLAELQTEGADSIVEACIMSGIYTHSRVQTTIANAWNPNDPSLDGHSLTPGGVTTASVPSPTE